MQPVLDRYTLTTEKLAAKIGYHIQYLRLLAASGKIPAIKRGRAWLFSEEEVLAWMRKNTEETLKGGVSSGNEDHSGSDLLQ